MVCDTKMDYEKYCDLDAFGVYSFVFPNKHALEIEEIENFFSQFEGYINVKAAFGDTGMRFIRFATFQHAKVAMDALHDHPTMRLIPYQRKSKGSNDPNATLNNNFKISSNDEEINLEVKKETTLNETGNSEFQTKLVRYRNTFGAMRLQKFREDFFKFWAVGSSKSSISKRKKKVDLVSEAVQNEVIDKNDKKLADDNSIVTDNEDVKSVKNFEIVKKDEKVENRENTIKVESDKKIAKVENAETTGKVKPTLKGEPTISLRMIKNEFSELVKICKDIQAEKKVWAKTEQSKLKEFNEKSEKPSRIYNKNLENSSKFIYSKNMIRSNCQQQRKVYPGLLADAAEIIIGHVPPSIKPPYFLHLLDKFEPIGISYMNQVANTEIRYCHAYFKSKKDAFKVINELDSFELNGNKLLVLFTRNLCKIN